MGLQGYPQQRCNSEYNAMLNYKISRHNWNNVNREFKLHVSGNSKRHAASNFLGRIFVERFRFIFSFLRRKNNDVFQF